MEYTLKDICKLNSWTIDFMFLVDRWVGIDFNDLIRCIPWPYDLFPEDSSGYVMIALDPSSASCNKGRVNDAPHGLGFNLQPTSISSVSVKVHWPKILTLFLSIFAVWAGNFQPFLFISGFWHLQHLVLEYCFDFQMHWNIGPILGWALVFFLFWWVITSFAYKLCF